MYNEPRTDRNIDDKSLSGMANTRLCGKSGDASRQYPGSFCGKSRIFLQELFADRRRVALKYVTIFGRLTCSKRQFFM